MSLSSSAAQAPMTAVFCTFLTLLVPLAAVGVAIMTAGLGRARSAAHAMLTSLCLAAVAALAYFVCGFAWQGVAGGAAHSVMIAGKSWSWIGAGHFFLRGIAFDDAGSSLAAALQLFGATIVVLIPLGTGNERWRLGAACTSTALLAGIVYPLFGHWAWGGGWLAQLGVNYGLGHGFVDTAGAGGICGVGGVAALTIAWIVGPRRSKYAGGTMPAAIPAHNAVFVLLGCFLAWLGWLGLNGAGAILHAGIEPVRLPLVLINTTLSAAAAVVMAVIITRVRFGKPDASLSANAWISGLVTSSAAAPFMAPAAATAAGLVVGVIVPLSVEWLEFNLGVDDPGGSISAYGVAGIWGLLAAGFLVHPNGSGQWLAQLIGVATLLGFVLPLTYAANFVLNRFYRQRVDRDGEQQGMDLHELGADAYPEFVIHSESLLPH